MASSSSFFIFLVLAISLQCTHTFSQTSLINDICKQARNPPLCSKALTSDPRSPNADLPTLNEIAIGQAQASAKSTKILINVLEKPITDPTIKEIYDTCAETYNDALDSLDSSEKALGSRDFDSLKTFASAVATDVDTCDQGFEDGITHEPPKLIQAGRDLADLVDVILIISNRLAGQKSL